MFRWRYNCEEYLWRKKTQTIFFTIHKDAPVVIKGAINILEYYTFYFVNEVDNEKYVQIHDGDIVIDEYGTGKRLKEKVCELIKNVPKKSKEEKQHQVEWCEKMFLSTKRDDTEGYFRWHWLLVDSLEIYFIICNEYYYGPKKSLLQLKKINPEVFNYYNNTLTKFDSESLKEWVSYLQYLFKEIND